jgi:hypothetical protein
VSFDADVRWTSLGPMDMAGLMWHDGREWRTLMDDVREVPLSRQTLATLEDWRTSRMIDALGLAMRAGYGGA